MSNPFTVQASYRWREDDDDLTSASWIHAVNTDLSAEAITFVYSFAGYAIRCLALLGSSNADLERGIVGGICGDRLALSEIHTDRGLAATRRTEPSGRLVPRRSALPGFRNEYTAQPVCS